MNLTVTAANTNGGASVRWLGREADSFIERRDSAITRILPSPTMLLAYILYRYHRRETASTADEIVNVFPLPSTGNNNRRTHHLPGDTVTLWRQITGFSAYQWSPEIKLLPQSW
ncbi:MAG: hypothetical protein IPI11_18510 [Haliscomenobacter sp.]|nr:hypothetical protein [Haliscomenobacter sp.]